MYDNCHLRFQIFFRYFCFVDTFILYSNCRLRISSISTWYFTQNSVMWVFWVFEVLVISAGALHGKQRMRRIWAPYTIYQSHRNFFFEIFTEYIIILLMSIQAFSYSLLYYIIEIYCVNKLLKGVVTIFASRRHNPYSRHWFLD